MACVCHDQITAKNLIFPWEESSVGVNIGLIAIFKEIFQSFLTHEWGWLTVRVWFGLARTKKHVFIPMSKSACYVVGVWVFFELSIRRVANRFQAIIANLRIGAVLAISI